MEQTWNDEIFKNYENFRGSKMFIITTEKGFCQEHYFTHNLSTMEEKRFQLKQGNDKWSVDNTDKQTTTT